MVDNEGNVINRYVGYSPGQEENYVKDISAYFNDKGIDYIPISLKEETIDLEDEDISIEF